MPPTLDTEGYAVVTPFLSPEECATVVQHLGRVPRGAAGSRNLLKFRWCADLADRLRSDGRIAALLPSNAVAAQCTLFEKTALSNWLVSMHQDLSIPVASRVDDTAVSGWSRKEGVLFAQPPDNLLSKLLAVRLHLDECGPLDGPLRVVPRSHLHGKVTGSTARALRAQFGETACSVPEGSALLMRPLILHASSKLVAGRVRRVLHFLFGPRELPHGLRWADAV